MNIYKIEAEGRFMWDSFDSHIIVSNTKKEVVKLAKGMAADEGEDAWKEVNVTLQGIYTGDKEEPFILLSSFNAG